ncbi:MAG: sensor histidine kinase, partial [Anaerolineales bacterium]
MPDDVIDFQNELTETQRALREVTLMIEQSQSELSKLTQRNTAITSHLQQVQKQGGTLEELKMAYDSALDAQQRLFVMRGQLEKLQNDKLHLEKYKTLLGNLLSSSNEDGGDSTSSVGVKNQMAGIEMIVNAQESERQRLSRQMHDGPAQALSNFILQTEIAMRLLDVDPAQAKEELGNLKNSAMGTFQKVRNFIFELRPMMLDDLGLAPTIKKYAEAFKEQTSLEINLTVTGNERRFEPYIEVMIFRA